ncbi:uncharacterized protein LODBEIA_P06510 [Lodderomyces beijingensis]|uniref:Uncharacterized protein n=1 Tax=Lodderomyces beijingensis TaxID=1775926 RepID=A0ABP0ZG70_9ASCO
MRSFKFTSLLLLAASSLVSAQTEGEDTTSYEGTTTVTTIPAVTATTTVPGQVNVEGIVYIWTNEEGVLTTTTVYVTTETGPVEQPPATSSEEPVVETSAAEPASSSGETPAETTEAPVSATTTAPAESSVTVPAETSSQDNLTALAPNVSTISVDVPEGDYATSTTTTYTTLLGGETAVLELVVLYTQVCSA